MGDAAVRAHQPQRRDDGATARAALAAARPRALPHGDRVRRARAAAEAGSGRARRRADRGAPERDRRPRPAVRAARRVRLPARGAGRASRRVRPTGRDRRRLPVDRRHPDPDRPVGRRGRPPDDVRRQRPALRRRSGRGDDLPRPRAHADRGRARPRRHVGGERAVGPRAVGAAGRRRPLRGHGVVGAVARRRTDLDHRCPARHRQGGADRAAPHARPRDRAARGGGRSRQGAGVDVVARSRQAVPTSARRAGAAARRGGRVLDDRFDAGEPRDTSRAGVRVGTDRRRRHRARRPVERARRPGADRDGGGRRCRVGDAPARDPARARARLPDRRRRDRAGSPRRADRRRPPSSRVRAAERAAGDRCRVGSHGPPPRPPPGASAQPSGGRRLRGPQARQLRRPLRARRRALRGDGQAHDRRHRTRLPARRLQGRRQAVRAVRPDRHAAPVLGRRGAHAAPPRRQRLRQVEEQGAVGGPRDRAGARRALPEAGQRRGPRVPGRHAVAVRDGGRLPVRRDA